MPADEGGREPGSPGAPDCESGRSVTDQTQPGNAAPERHDSLSSLDGA